jgi:hypothetical protein
MLMAKRRRPSDLDPRLARQPYVFRGESFLVRFRFIRADKRHRRHAHRQQARRQRRGMNDHAAAAPQPAAAT